MMLNPKLRAPFAIAHDTTATAVAWLLAYWLRFNLDIPAEYWRAALGALMWVVPLHALVFIRAGLYRGIWRYASLSDLQRILMTVGLTALGLAAMILMAGVEQVPRSVLILHPALLILMMGGSRFLYRAWKEHSLYGALRIEGKPVLILGAGDAAVMLLKELERSRDWRVVGLLDDDESKHERHLLGVRILGPVSDLDRWVRESEVEHVILAMPSATAAVRRSAIERAAQSGVSVLTVPALVDLLNGRVSISQVRKVELEDLLGRDPVSLDTEGLHTFLSRQVVMVTGAGGSIGSELCRQIAAFQPSLLVLFEANEFALYNIEQEFRERSPGTQIVSAIGDVKNPRRVGQVMHKFSPAVVFHAAAYKHVPMMEENNAWEAVQNNVMGTHVVARAAIKYGVKKFVLVSTDKAVNPTNVMGATKRLAEMVCQSLQQESETRFEMVRFGNVLGSAGSVIPKFREQLERGGPITVTHPDIIRYFMSIPEAAQLVLQAGCMGQGGEIFVMDMGEPVRIVDLARDMIRLSGFSDDEIKIVFTGLRPGEKLFEELLADDEQTRPTPHPKLRIAKAREVEPGWIEELLRWLRQDRVLDDGEVRRDLRRWVPEYAPDTRPPLRAVGGGKPGHTS